MERQKIFSRKTTSNSMLKIRFYRYFIGLLFFFAFFPSPLSAAGSIVLENQMEGLSIGQHIAFFEDGSNQLNISDVSGPEFSDRFTIWTKDSLGFGFTESAYWLRFTINNPSIKNIHWLLDSGYHLLDDIKLYIPDGNGGYTVKSEGDTKPFNSREFDHRNFTFPIESPPGLWQFYIRVNTTSSMNLPIKIWSPDAFFRHIKDEQLLLGIYYGFLIILFLYNLFILFSIRELSYFYYISYIVSYLLVSVSLNGIGFEYLWPNSIWLCDSAATLIALALVLMLLFTRYFLNTKKNTPKFDKLLLALLFIDFSILFASFFLPYRTAISIAALFIIITCLFLITIGSFSFIKKIREARFFLIAFALLILFVIAVSLKNFGILPNNFITIYGIEIGSAMQMLLFSLGLADKINVMKNQLQDLNLNLEKKVDQRTKMLKTSLDHVNKLKEKQDGDYFLISLLTEPMNFKIVHSDNVQIEFFIKEKKEFKFRKWHKEIGGDMCLAHSIELRDRSYTFFLNADAMGKSIQGAGGVIVMGVVVKSILERTFAISSIKKQFPEKWLKNSFKEIQKVFEGFDGSMLMSMIMGLIDDQTGFVYFVNVEHPWAILYRDSKASFIENDLSFYKIGTTLNRHKFWVQTFQLQTHDKLFIGSDGKDDILINLIEDDKQMIMNEDEHKILEHIENGHGQIDKIVAQIHAFGKVTDDLSLLTLSFTPLNKPNAMLSSYKTILANAKALLTDGQSNDAAEIIKQNISAQLKQKFIHKELVHLLIQISSEQKDYETFSQYANLYSEFFPHKSQYIYLASLAAFKCDKLDFAADLSERYRLRFPKDVPNLVHLTKIYQRLGDSKRSKKIIRQALEYQPDNPKAQQLLKSLA